MPAARPELCFLAKSRSSPFCPDEHWSLTTLREKLVKINVPMKAGIVFDS